MRDVPPHHTPVDFVPDPAMVYACSQIILACIAMLILVVLSQHIDWTGIDKRRREKRAKIKSRRDNEPPHAS